MEDNEKESKDLQQEEENSEQKSKPTAEPAVSRRDRRKKPKANKKLLFVIIIIILIVSAAVFLLREPDIESEPIAEPTISEQNENPTSTPTFEPINRENVSIQVLNGTGIGGQAAYLQGQLEELGYGDIDVGNADEQDYEETIVTYSSSVDERVQDEITQRLESLYQEVDAKTGSSGNYDIQIIAGLREGQALPTDTPTPTPTQVVTATPTPSITPTTITPSPTP